ncbi:MAG: FRG domain-containing protein [candidate division Zixibacteria bacterium]|nr:FRG domain-containing protein [candidate division Zixibacteria bacterium]
MRIIEGKLPESIKQLIGTKSIDKDSPIEAKTFKELMKLIAQLAYLNKDYLLFFRGQNLDYKNRVGASSFYPSIYRYDSLSNEEIRYQFDILNQTSISLVEAFKQSGIDGYQEMRKKKYIQWSILQHYEVCKTPLLDMTHSVRVACSFAQRNNSSEYSYISVFGLPYLTNRISINSEHDLVNVRLLSICPPDALRPYFQDGYMVGTEDVTDNYESKTELDFNNRLILKIRIPSSKDFWEKGLTRIPDNVLYPQRDLVAKICKSIKTNLVTEIHPGDIGTFLKSWIELEEFLIENASKKKVKTLSVRKAISVLIKSQSIEQNLGYRIDNIRKFRNQLVHKPKEIKATSIKEYIAMLVDIKRVLKNNNL